MSKIKRAYFPEAYALIDGITAVADKPSREDLEQQAKDATCACYYYDVADNVESATDEELYKIIANPYHAHEAQEDGEDWKDDCPQYQMEQAEKIRDGKREDGESV